MNTSMKEMNLNEMESVSGGIDWNRVRSKFGVTDVALCIILGPIGQVIVASKAGGIIAGEIASSK